MIRLRPLSGKGFFALGVAVLVAAAVAGNASWKPGDSIVLLPGDFLEQVLFLGPEESPPKDGRQDHWLGVFGSQLTDVSVTVQPVPPTVEEGMGGFALKCAPPAPDLLFRSVPGLRPGRVLECVRDIPLGENKSTALVVGRRRYAVVWEVAASRDRHRVILKLDGKEQILFDSDHESPDVSLDDPSFTIHWAGDLDEDGKLDLVATFAKKYSWLPRRLWLSKDAPRETLVRLAGEFVLGC